MTARHACPGCPRQFLSRAALRRHYQSNPGHAAPSSGQAGGGPAGGGWVCFADTVETFRALPAGVGAAGLTVEYEPGTETVAVSGGYEERIDASPVAALVAGEPTWTARGGFLVVSFERA